MTLTPLISWVVERSFGWAARFRRLARDYEKLPQTLAGLHYVAFALLMLPHLPDVISMVQNMLEAGRDS